MNKIQKILVSIWGPMLVSFIIMQVTFKLSYGRVWFAYKSPWIWFFCFLTTGVFLFFFWGEGFTAKKILPNEEKVHPQNKTRPKSENTDDILKELTKGRNS